MKFISHSQRVLLLGELGAGTALQSLLGIQVNGDSAPSGGHPGFHQPEPEGLSFGMGHPGRGTRHSPGSLGLGPRHMALCTPGEMEVIETGVTRCHPALCPGRGVNAFGKPPLVLNLDSAIHYLYGTLTPCFHIKSTDGGGLLFVWVFNPCMEPRSSPMECLCACRCPLVMTLPPKCRLHQNRGWAAINESGNLISQPAAWRLVGIP